MLIHLSHRVFHFLDLLEPSVPASQCFSAVWYPPSREGLGLVGAGFWFSKNCSLDGGVYSAAGHALGHFLNNL